MPNAAPSAVGFILSSINGESTEHLPFEDVMRKISRTKSPHTAEFLRYDYRYDAISRQWHSLDALRARGVCLEDPMLQTASFVGAAAAGDLDAVSDLLVQGTDPNCSDYSGSTALHVAAANSHSEIVELLVTSGALVNCRDKNVIVLCQLLIGYLSRCYPASAL